MKEFIAEYVSPDDLIPYEMNAKLHPPEQVEHIANSIKAFGWTQPIVVDENNVVVIGHGRLMAAKQLNLDKVPVVRRDDLTEEQINACRLADNKTNESPWDFGKLEEELAHLAIDGIDMADFGFENMDEPIPENLDAEEDTEHKIFVKFTFSDYQSYMPYENELKETAERIGAEFGLMKG